MKVSPRLAVTGILAASLGTMSGLALAGKDVSIDQVPAAVRQTIEREKGAGTIDEIEQETRNGATVYEVEIKREGTSRDIRVGADGALLPESTGDRMENAVKSAVAGSSLTLDQVPPAVRKTVEGQLQGGRVEEIEKENENGRVVYEVDIEQANGDDRTINVAEDGTLLPDDDDDATTGSVRSRDTGTTRTE